MQGKLSEKKSYMASSPEKKFLHGEKYSCKENVKEKNSCSSKIPDSTPLPPPITFLMVRPLTRIGEAWGFVAFPFSAELDKNRSS